MNWQTKKLGETILIIVFIMFAILFLRAEQYWITFLTLSLILVAWRVSDIRHFSVNLKGVDVKLSTIHKEAEKILRTDKTIEEKVKASQELIDEAFCVGYQTAGGKITGTIANVQIAGNKNGSKNIQYDEVP